MKKTLTALVILLRTFAEEIEALAEESAATPAETVTGPPGKKRGRPAAVTQAPVPTNEGPAEPIGPSEERANKVIEELGALNKDIQELKAQNKTVEELRAIIAPVVKGQAGPQVKEVMRKYGCESIVEISAKPEVHADFQKDIEAIVY